MELYAPATPPGTWAKNAAGSFLPSSLVRTVEPTIMKNISIHTIYAGKEKRTDGNTEDITKVAHEYEKGERLSGE